MNRLLEKCQAILRIPAESKGANQDLKIASKRGLEVYYHLNQISDAGQ